MKPSATFWRLTLSLVAVATALAAWLSPPIAEPVVFAQSSAPLLPAGGLIYEGAFRLPDGDDRNTFRYGTSVLAYDPWRQSIWGVGHDQHQRIAEISIPDPGTATTLAALPRATLKTGWFDTAWRSRIGARTPKIGGILPQPNGDLIISAYEFYDNVGLSVSHFRRDADGAVTGPVRVFGDAPGGGFAAGRMLWVPQEWRSAIGYPALTGQCCLSTINRTSLGPALIGFDPAHVAGRNPVPATWLLGYPNSNGRQTLGTTARGQLYNGSANNNYAGIVWIHGTRTLIAVQRIGTGTVVYAGGYQAPPDVVMALAYDANDLVAVKNGRKQPWEVVPYAHWNLLLPLGSVTGRTDHQSITYDPSTARLFMSIHSGVAGGEHIVLVYKADASAPPQKANPPAGPGASGFRTRKGGPSLPGRPKATRLAEPESPIVREEPREEPRTESPAPRSANAAVEMPARLATSRSKADHADPSRVRTLGVVHYVELAAGLGVWVIVTAGAVYEVPALDPAYQLEGLPVLFEGWIRTTDTATADGSYVLDLRDLTGL